MPPKSLARNVILLASCQAMGMSCMSLSITISALVGAGLAPEPSLSTLPLSIQFVGTMMATIPASLIMGRYGRRAGFSLGAFLGIIAGILSAYAVYRADFELFCLGSFFLGAWAAHLSYLRFAAADGVEVAYRSRAISYVMAGGLVAAILGPELAKQAKDLFAPILFAGSYLAVVGLSLGCLVLFQFLDIPPPNKSEYRSSGRPLNLLVRQPKVIVAVLCAMVGYGAMNLVMVSTPLAMAACAHPFAASTVVIQSHVVAMFLPSFFTGSLIHRFGNLRILQVGAVLICGAIAVNLSGVEIIQFWTALVLLGLGWNFLFVGGTTLLTETYMPEEKAKVQAFNDFCVFGATVVTAFSSGFLFSSIGWEAVNLVVLPGLLGVMVLIFWLGRRERQAALTSA
ncbi:MAG: MFS transporter [Pseudomonadota bacterium]